MAKLPRHIGFIPDGNRRWAVERGLRKQDGYERGIKPGLVLLEECQRIGINEVSIYGFTKDNTRRPSAQKEAFCSACVAFGEAAARQNAALRVVGDDSSPVFPDALRPYRSRQGSGIRANLLVNYGWEWDLDGLKNGVLRSRDVPRLDLIVRWGGGRRLSGFLPVQSVYADIYVVDAYWPDFQISHLHEALAWYERQDVTLGG